MITDSNHTLEEVEGEELRRVEKFHNLGVGKMLRVNPGGWLFPGPYKFVANKVYNFQWSSSDVVLIGFLKTGTTWMQEILWNMRNNPDLDHPEADSPVYTRVPLLEGDMAFNPAFIEVELEPDNPLNEIVRDFKRRFPDGNPKDGIYIQTAQALEEPRTIKTHLPLSLLHPTFLDKTKCVYITRNPRDAFVSYFHMARLAQLMSYNGTFDDFLDGILKGEIMYTPFHQHVKEAWERRNHPNLHIVFYEDLKANTAEELKKLDKFMGTNLTPEQLRKIEHYTSFSEMKKRDNVTNTKRPDNIHVRKDVEQESGGFFRKGIVGGWKEHFSPETLAKFDEWMKENMKEIPFRYSS